MTSMTTEATTFAAVRACVIVLLTGAVLQVMGVSAGNGIVIDWRTVRCGEVLVTCADAFDVAQLFVALVGPDAATLAASRDVDIEPAPTPPPMVPRVHAYMVDSGIGGPRRSFEAPGGFRVYVEPHEDDAGQAAFAAKLAEFCATAAV
jgi:hypothetical protein